MNLELINSHIIDFYRFTDYYLLINTDKTYIKEERSQKTKKEIGHLV